MFINSKTRIMGLFGYPIGHSISPELHNQAIADLDLNYAYLPFPFAPDRLADGVQAIRSLGIRGVNVTIPYKEKVIPFLDEINPLAAKIGAVNTIVNNNDYLVGYNTDLPGFIRMIEEDGNFKIKDKTVVVIGAGGASRAIGIALCQQQAAEIYLLNRTKEKAERLVRLWRGYYPEHDIKAADLNYKSYQPLVERADLIVDTTPVGMSPAVEVEPVITADCFRPEQLVVDLVYNPAETTLLTAANQAGATTLNGLGMLLYQGIESFKLWTGREPAVDAWQEIAKKHLYKDYDI